MLTQKDDTIILSSVYSSLAQLVEHAAVNRRVVGSSPTGGAKEQEQVKRPVLVLYFSCYTQIYFPRLTAARLLTAPRDKKYAGGIFLPLETAETGSIGSGSDRDDHVSRRKGRWPCVLPRGL